MSTYIAIDTKDDNTCTVRIKNCPSDLLKTLKVEPKYFHQYTGTIEFEGELKVGKTSIRFEWVEPATDFAAQQLPEDERKEYLEWKAKEAKNAKDAKASD